MFFDTETTGLPENYNAPSSDVNNWPRIVQISWTITDKMGNILSERDAVIKPEGFTIPYHSIDVHGITNEFAIKYGLPLNVVLDNFIKDMSSIKCIVGHNIDFDKKVIEAECYRKRIEIDFDRVESICTMEATVDFMEDYLERRKYPKLQELYYALFEEDIENIHNSMNDVNATMRCFFELKNREVL
ncbi:MAG: 3'-5' exonuclease [Prevotella sp.]|nr:3'-5' exonuclease [Prevotella sp.]